ncbi:MAG TPA: hypothetical protein VGM41_05860 [Chitinophagaceae bacterium]
MRYILLLSLLVPLVLAASSCWAQTGVPPAAVQLANKQADRMRDSLGLNASQRQRIYDANIYLHNCKTQAWSQYSTDRTRLQQELQTIENRRDSLYNVILGSPDKYQLYKAKKATIVKTN